MFWLLFKTVLAVFVAVVLVSFMLPQDIIVSRSLSMNASASQIFTLVNRPKNMTQWSPWALRDPDMVMIYSGAEAGKGAISEWKSDTEGTGRQEIIESKTDRLVVTALDFGKKGSAEARFILRPDSERKTHVTWRMTSDAGYNPLMRWMGFLFFDGWVGKDYEQGLHNLKILVEKGKAKP